MQEMNELQLPCKRPCALKESAIAARTALQVNERLLTLMITYLFCVVALFFVAFAVTALSVFWVPMTFRQMLIHWITDTLLWAALFGLVLLPLFTGWMRMAGMIAAGRTPDKAELFYYFTTRRLWWRGVRIALLWPIAVFLPSYFAAPALAIGNEDLSLSRALSLARTRLPFSRALAFLGRALVRLVLCVLTLGLLWLLYDAYHSAVMYFSLCMKEREENEYL